LWRVVVQYRAWRERDDLVAIEVLLTNDLGRHEAGSLPKHFDPHIFAPDLTLMAPVGLFKPFVLSMLPTRDYRIDPYSLGLGVNCDTVLEEKDHVVKISTDYLPVHEQFRNRPNPIPEYEYGAPTFHELVEDPIPHLERVHEELERYADEWSNRFDDFVEQGVLTSANEEDFLLARDMFRKEVVRFAEGLRVLSENAGLLTAFRLMNESFDAYSRARPQLKAWYPFQLVFIVSNLPDFLMREDRHSSIEPPPHVLWYPTGGGKTEAYMGLIITHAFWDRLRGKKFGVTAWCKFPLRLLSMQQLSRICTLVTYAERTRKASNLIPPEVGGDPFSVGLFAGSRNSANYLDWPPDASRQTSLSRYGIPKRPNDIDSAHRFIKNNRKVDLCPICPSEGGAEPGQIVTVFDHRFPRFNHICAKCGYRLNLHVSDTETLRFLPTVVVGTIDKLAVLGRNPETKVLFGYARRRCERHGYFLHELDTCTVLRCGRELEDVSDAIDPTPSLLIQDELHFLRETLGAFDSHYETMTLAIMRRAARELSPRLGAGWKVVGSTATIEGYEEQMRHLYGRSDAVRFPVSGPVRGQQFYSCDDPSDIQRHILGFRPQNMSHIDAVMKVILSFHRVVLPLAAGEDDAWKSLGEPLSSLNDDERKTLIKRYRTSLAYALTRAECGQINKSFVQQLNPQLLKDGLPEFEDHRIRNLTGEADSDDVQRALNDLESPSEEWIQAVTATSMISHGVDLEVLNFIVFRGPPHTSSDWIQAMSRVGRVAGFPSIVVNVYNPNRERDATYYRHHKKYIEHADALIRVVPITRFSPAALRKTAPGLFYNAVAYFAAPPGVPHYYREQLKRTLPAIKDEVRGLMREYLALPTTDLDPKELRLLQELSNQLELIQHLLENPTSPENTKKAIRPMTSLREVDELVVISPQYDFRRFSRPRS
jgi:hypothetical protein